MGRRNACIFLATACLLYCSCGNKLQAQDGKTENTFHKTLNGTCSFDLSKDSTTLLKELFNKNSTKVVVIHLNFSVALEKNPTVPVMYPQNWTWVNCRKLLATRPIGNFQFDFDLFSLGLLGRDIDHAGQVYMEVTPGNCSMALGDLDTHIKISEALKKAVDSKNRLSSLVCNDWINDIYNKSHTWFYLSRLFGVMRDYTALRCCHGINSQNCEIIKQAAWLQFLQAVGIFIFLYSPLFLQYFPDQSRQSSKQIPSRREELLVNEDNESYNTTKENETWIYLGESSIYFGELLNRVFCMNFKSVLLSRCRRFLFPVFTCSICFARVAVYYHFKKDFVQDRLTFNVAVGDLCLPFGFSACYRNAEAGGRYVHYGVYLFLSGITLAFPSSLEHVLTWNLLQNAGELNIFSLDVLTLRRYSSVQIQETTSLQTLGNVMKCHLNILLNYKFWMLVLKHHWCLLKFAHGQVHSYQHRKISYVVLWLKMVCLGIGYFFKILFAFFYYGIPLIHLSRVAIYGYMSYTRALHQQCLASGRHAISRIPTHLGFILLYVLVFLGLTCMTCGLVYVFITSFTFVTMIVFFTFTGILSFPSQCLVYVIGANAFVYYAWSAISEVTQFYQQLLLDAVMTSEQLQENIHSKNRDDIDYCIPNGIILLQEHPQTGALGIPRNEFYFIVEHICPLRTKLAAAIVKLSIYFILGYFIVNFVLTFDQGQNVTMISQVLATIFVSLFPQILQRFKSSAYINTKEYMRMRELKHLIATYWLAVTSDPGNVIDGRSA